MVASDPKFGRAILRKLLVFKNRGGEPVGPPQGVQVETLIFNANTFQRATTIRASSGKATTEMPGVRHGWPLLAPIAIYSRFATPYFDAVARCGHRKLDRCVWQTPIETHDFIGLGATNLTKPYIIYTVW